MSLLQMADMYLPIYIGATVHFAQPDALKVCTTAQLVAHLK